MASDIAVMSGTPRTARLVTASSHSTSVRIAEAAKTTAYCFRNVRFVKSTSAVSLTASESLSTVQEAASAQPWAREERGSRVVVTSLGRVLVSPFSPDSRSQYFLASPTMRSQGLFDDEGDGDGVGAA